MRYADYKAKLIRRKAFIKKLIKFIPLIAVLILGLVAGITILVINYGNVNSVSDYTYNLWDKIDINGSAFMSALTPDTDYNIYYRYAADNDYCASESVLRIIHTMSKDEELYVDTCVAALDYIQRAASQIDNRKADEIIIFFYSVC